MDEHIALGQLDSAIMGIGNADNSCPPVCGRLHGGYLELLTSHQWLTVGHGLTNLNGFVDGLLEGC